MKRICIAVLGLCLVAGCVSLEKKWQRAQEQDDILAYETFLRKYPDAPQAAEAQAQLERIMHHRADRLAFERAQRRGTVAAFEAYLKDFPTGVGSAESAERLRALRYEAALKNPDEEAYQSFLDLYAEGDDVADIRGRLRALRYEAARDSATLAAYEAFLKQYSTGTDAEALREALPEMRARRLAELATLMVEFSVVGGVDPNTGQHAFHPSFEAADEQPLLIEEFRSLLESGVDPTKYGVSGLGEIETERRGMLELNTFHGPDVVPAIQGGMTLMEFLEATGQGEAAKLLRQYRSIR